MIKDKVMVKLKNKDLFVVEASLLYLSEAGTKAWYGVSRNLQKIRKPLEELGESRTAIAEKLGKRDENDKLVYSGEGKERFVVWKDDKAEEEANKLWESTLNEDAKKIDWYKINIEKLDDTELNGAALSPLLDIILVDE